MRLLRALLLVKLGAWAGMLAAAAVVKRVLPSRGDEESDQLALTAVFDGIDLKSRAGDFRGGSLFAWFGGIAVDLRQASLGPEARLTVGALFGGVDVRVPPGWRVESTARALFGGVADDLDVPDDPAAPTLTIESTTIFGGISISRADTEPAAG